MPNLNQKYHLYTIHWYGVILKRFYVGDSPDEVGTIEFWSEPVRQLFDQMPFAQLWNGLELEIWHMCSPDLVTQNKQTLLDYDLSKPGCQSAVGLTFGKKKICLGVYPEGFMPGYSDNPVDVTESNRQCTRKALSHEFGHLLHFGADLDAANTIGQEMRREWDVLRPRQAANTHEDWAECCRALFGTSDVRGTFSDGKPFVPTPRLFTFLKVAYWLGVNLSSRPVNDLTVFDTFVRWYRTDESKYYALTSNWEQFAWNGTGWNRV